MNASDDPRHAHDDSDPPVPKPKTEPHRAGPQEVEMDLNGSSATRIENSINSSRETKNSEKSHQPQITLSEFFGVLALIALVDLTVYRGNGFAGYALLILLAPILLWISSTRRNAGTALWVISLMLVAMSAKLLWCGSFFLAGTGFALIVGFSMAVAGFQPFVLEATFFASQILHAGYRGIIHFARQLKHIGPSIPQSAWVSVLLPLMALLAFGWIFVFANPDLARSFVIRMEYAFDNIHRWVLEFSPKPLEISIWAATLWLVLGLLRPTIDRSYFTTGEENDKRDAEPASGELFLYPALRNTLYTVIGLFTVYLVFEFVTLWGREFPEGFYYSGYAHDGAVWLTAALALTTAILSLTFRGSVLKDRRIGKLKKLAWVWSIQNFILAAAVFNRLFIYIGFNGMTRMRIVGLVGISAVVVGFMLVLWKIARKKAFVWLVRRHLWTLAVAVYLLALMPMDYFVVKYNVYRILNGDPAPVVQISVHPINSEGILLLQPLLDSENETIREGVRALLAERHLELQNTQKHRLQAGWTAYQISDRMVAEELNENRKRWSQYLDAERRKRALVRFHKFAYRWF